MIPDQTSLIRQCQTSFVGLAPFLRLSIAGQDLRVIAQALLATASHEEQNANLWMNLATAMFTIGQRDVGLSIQEQALLMARSFHLPAQQQPGRHRLLVLAVAGDIAENTPIDCLLEASDSDLVFYYATPEAPLPADLASHDAVLVAISDSPRNRPLLNILQFLLERSKVRLINAPRHIPNTERGQASELLQGAPGIAMPRTRQVPRQILQNIASGQLRLGDLFADCAFPIILRPLGSQAGRDLVRIDNPADIAPYLAKVGDSAFYLARFIDYSGSDGLFRKYRIALVNGQPLACHMGISAHWMIHYVNAGMYEDAAKRREEAQFMEQFGQFAERHRAALDAIAQRSQLDYACIDCAETREGELLVFELDHTMVVHAMDPVDLFPYKKNQIQRIREAFEMLICRPSAS